MQPNALVTRLAVDTMGSDQGPGMVLKGVALFLHSCPTPECLLYGDQEVLRPLLDQQPAHVQARCTVIHTCQVVAQETKVLQALRHLPQSSMKLALQSVADGHADGAVSAGNTGAYMALAKSVLQTIPGVDRPAIVSQMPTEKGESIMLDLGGNLQASSRNLLEYAVMGDAFARHALAEAHPTIGLLNVGKENTKGHDGLQQAYQLLQESSLNFYGFIEGDDIPKGTVSVVVTDGFTGNIALKTAEGVAKMCLHATRRCLTGGWRARLAGYMAKPFLGALKQQLDPRLYNGALWLGLNGVAVKSHGGTDAVGFAHALEVAFDMIKGRVVDTVKQAMTQHADSLDRSSQSFQ